MGSRAKARRPLLPYGEGIYRRRILLSKTDNLVTGSLEDDAHGFRIFLHHDGSKVQDIEAESLRVPYTACHNAGTALKGLIGVRLGSSRSTLKMTSHPKSNCTHLYNLAWLCINHAARKSSGDYLYDVSVSDEVDGQVEMGVLLNKVPVHQWTAKGHRIEIPGSLAGNSVLKGFSQWVGDQFGDDALEAAYVLNDGYFVSQYRRKRDGLRLGESALSESPHMVGRCYSFSPDIAANAVRETLVDKDFTHHADELLTFTP